MTKQNDAIGKSDNEIIIPSEIHTAIDEMMIKAGYTKGAKKLAVLVKDYIITELERAQRMEKALEIIYRDSEDAEIGYQAKQAIDDAPTIKPQEGVK